MSWLTLGSLALPFTMNRNTLVLKTEMTRLSQEMITGVAMDPQRRLKGDLGPLGAVESRLARIEAYTQANTLATNAADIAQSALTRAGDSASEIGNRMLAVSTDGIAPATLRAGAAAARSALGDLSSTLAQRVAGRAVFSGVASDMAPVPDAETILAAVLPAVTGLATPQDIVDAVNAAFLDPGGVFETSLYQGGPAAEGPRSTPPPMPPPCRRPRTRRCAR
jgi:Bacterial flagellin N-terminal helical region.